MTKLAIMSDLHIDLNHFSTFETKTLINLLKKEKIDHLHIAGDISNHFTKDTLSFINNLKKHIKLSYNLGNHDMLDLTETEIQRLDFQTYRFDKKMLLAFHGWYDYSFSNNRDIKNVEKLKKTFWFDRRLKRPNNDVTIQASILKRLDEILSKVDSSNIIIAMHFVPHKQFTMTHPRFSPFNAFLGSQAYHDLFQKYHIKDVVFGHAHRSFDDVKIGETTYHSRPLGYIREWNLTIDFVNQNPNHNPNLTWNLSKRYNAVKHLDSFENYRKKYFEDELRNSMTIFDC
ncbi:TPA: metallophosphoesterase [Streptococcus agalactiae]|nr:metallophosphoesterase [Streptococcus agalactiae]